MSDSIDDLLAQLQPTQPSSAQPGLPPPAAKSAPNRPHPASAIENLLADLDGLDLDELDNNPAKAAAKAPAEPQPNSSQPSANPHFDALIHQQPHQQSFQQSPQQCVQSGPADLAEPGPELFRAESADRMLAELKSLYQEQDQAAALRQQEALQIEQERQETLKRQRQGAINRQAQNWLNALDPASGEAAWFDEFAAKYNSRLAAAIDYLGLQAN